MNQLLEVLRLGITGTALDIDNAMYMTSVIDHLKPSQQRKAIILGLLVELAARYLMIWLFLYVVSGTEAFFTVFGVDITIDSLALFAAGGFLVIKSSKELVEFFAQPASESRDPTPTELPFSRVMVELIVMSALLSIDTVVGITAITQDLALLTYMFLFSALVRLLFVRQIARFVQRYPSMNIVILAFLILFGAELIVQGLEADFEIPFNSLMLVAFVGAGLYERHRSHKEPTS